MFAWTLARKPKLAIDFDCLCNREAALLGNAVGTAKCACNENAQAGHCPITQVALDPQAKQSDLQARRHKCVPQRGGMTTGTLPFANGASERKTQRAA